MSCTLGVRRTMAVSDHRSQGSRILLSPWTAAPMLITNPIYVLFCVFCAVQFCYPQQKICEPVVVVNVRDKQGHFVPSLKAVDFQGKNANVTSVSQGRPPRVIILLDKSGSM